MSYIGKTPTSVPLTSSDITDGIITTAKITDDAITSAKLGTGDMAFPNGNLVFETAAKGIYLGVTSATAANLLDDYEEGTWTPSVGGNTSYNVQYGKYTKVGNMVTLVCEMNINVIGTGSTTTISGAPFTPMSYSGSASAAVGYASSLATNIMLLTFRMDGGNSEIHNAVLTSAASTTVSSVAIFGNSARVLFSITYIATA